MIPLFLMIAPAKKQCGSSLCYSLLRYTYVELLTRYGYQLR